MQWHFYETKVHDVDNLKQCLTDVLPECNKVLLTESLTSCTSPCLH